MFTGWPHYRDMYEYSTYIRYSYFRNKLPYVVADYEVTNPDSTLRILCNLKICMMKEYTGTTYRKVSLLYIKVGKITANFAVGAAAAYCTNRLH